LTQARRPGQSSLAALFVALVALGILAMHALPEPGAAHVMRDPLAASPVGHLLSTETVPAGDLASMPDHGHAFLGCLWIVLGGAVVLIAAVRPLLGAGFDDTASSGAPPAFVASRRAPPMSRRLSLVGVLRR
jgi:hypothetical protein